ncbi:Transcriptional activator protein NhaR [compost metagenome]
MAYRMLDATRSLDQPIRLVCLEDEFESLLADLALHKLDLVLTDRAVPAGASLRVSSHLWGESAMKLFGIPALAEQYRDNFPHSLHGAPFLLPARNNALRGRIDEWMVQQGVRPDVVGEFEDNAMLNAFGRKGLGLFFASASLAADIEEQFGAVLVGDASSLREQFYVISNERKIMHPALDVILAAIQGHPKIHKET